MLMTEPQTYQCFWCDCTTTDSTKVSISLPSGRLICHECEKHDRGGVPCPDCAADPEGICGACDAKADDENAAIWAGAEKATWPLIDPEDAL